MKQYAGLDVSLKEATICVVDEAGSTVARGAVPTAPDAIVGFFAEKKTAPGRIVHESGLLSIWLHRELEKRGLPIVCVDARIAHKALSARLNKSDSADAEGLAQLARTGWYRQVHVRSIVSDRLRTLIGARERLGRLRKDLESHVRGVLKTFGVQLEPVKTARHRAAAGELEPVLAILAETFSPAHKALCTATAAIEEELRAIAKESPLARRLMTVPGVGALVALGFIATVDDASRFRKASDIGAFLGLTPRRYQSGDTDRSGRISKCGSGAMRSLLYEAATSLICHVTRFSSLKSWAMRLAARKGYKKAAVATARKIAVVLHCIWVDGTEFEWTKKEATA
ncbi:IS110 family transposase [Paralimibaculum aggregatum]|uniref:IS110 family transposase n=1 Tax=Paralimibaculum aggregatum TaxID=3036245 RepID=A0ABQ6LU36_9RHOB|nr:IS110 family transposase [Limibaculum sp. NKW23]GMG85567.1 IS110 family transposase [Limibaculum sp. NKW23]